MTLLGVRRIQLVSYKLGPFEIHVGHWDGHPIQALLNTERWVTLLVENMEKHRLCGTTHWSSSTKRLLKAIRCVFSSYTW